MDDDVADTTEPRTERTQQPNFEAAAAWMRIEGGGKGGRRERQKVFLSPRRPGKFGSVCIYSSCVCGARLVASVDGIRKEGGRKGSLCDSRIEVTAGGRGERHREREEATNWFSLDRKAFSLHRILYLVTLSACL